MNESNTDPLTNAWADHSRMWRSNVYVYPVISRRAGGISIGINLNIDKACTFDCPYCQVDRTIATPKRPIDPDAISAEVETMIGAYKTNGLADFPHFGAVPAPKRVLRDLCLSGDGESTMAPEFTEVCLRLQEIQAAHSSLDLKLVLITNATLLDKLHVQKGLNHLCSQRGEIWGKLDAGTEEWFQKVNVSRYHLDRIESNLQLTVAHYPLRVQTMLCTLQNHAPTATELSAYVQRVARIRQSNPANFLSVQLYSVVRSTARPEVGPVPVAFLEQVAHMLTTQSPGIEVGIYP